MEQLLGIIERAEWIIWFAFPKLHLPAMPHLGVAVVVVVMVLMLALDGRGRGDYLKPLGAKC